MSSNVENEAFDLFRARDYVAARKLFSKLQESATTSEAKEAAKHNEANCYAAEGNSQKALEILADIESKPDDIGLIYSRALSLIRLGNYDAAVAQLDKLTLSESMSLNARDAVDVLKPILNLVTICANSSHLWKNYHTNCRILESFLLKLRPSVNDDGQHIWQKNMAHVMFMMDTCYDDCSQAYQDIVLTSQQQLGPQSDIDEQQRQHLSYANVDPIVLRNLCVSYILTGQNRDAEQLIKEVEYEAAVEREQHEMDPTSGLYDSGGDGFASMKVEDSASKVPESSTAALQLMHINLAVGTLYCVKNNYEFGLARIIETLEPLERRLTTFAWNQAKRCILSLLDKLCRQLIYVKDDLLDRLVAFLMRCEINGLSVPTQNNNSGAVNKADEGRNSVTYEARYLRAILLSVIHD